MHRSSWNSRRANSPKNSSSATDPTRNVELMSLIRAMQLIGRIALTECYLGPKARYIHIALDRTHLDEYPFI